MPVKPMTKKLPLKSQPQCAYVDPEGVRRGWYVYQHIDNATKKVFYVGKGIGRRAWSDKRNRHWHEYVSNLTDGYTVEIVKDDLSDLESIALEIEIIEQHGGGQLETGELTNIIPGDPGHIGVRISVETVAQDEGVKGLLGKYETLIEEVKESGDTDLMKELGLIEDEVTFIPGKRIVTEKIAKSLAEKSDSIYSEIEEWMGESEESGHDELVDVALAFIELEAISDLCNYYLKRRMSWADFCDEVWVTFGDFRYVAQNLKDNPPEFEIDYKPLIDVLNLVGDFSKQMIVSD
jgi:hypothetical protein